MVTLFIALGSVSLAILAGVLPLLFYRSKNSFPLFIHFILLGLSGLGFLIAGIWGLFLKVSFQIVLPLGVPWVSWAIRLDVLSSFFLCLMGFIVFAIAFYGPDYLKYEAEKSLPIRSLLFFTGLFIASMGLVILAENLYSFMFSWELMSVTSYFLVISHYDNTENQRAGLVYLLMAHLSGLIILVAFCLLAKFSDGSDFQSFALSHLSTGWATLVFLLAFIGFGMKAGLVPLHVWLPQAHPVAPSHISALMSGVMLKVAVYGFIRLIFILLNQMCWQWGVLVLFIGCLSALLGVLYAIMQHHLKRLLAYHSVENIGIIFIGLGLSMIFVSNGNFLLGALGLIAALYHCLNHALFKSLLFLGAGTIVQRAREHDLENMGGLIHQIPATAFFFLIGCLSISALPPFNGFVSEWLTFQTSLQASVLHNGIMRAVLPLAAAILALTGALAAACFAKVYGIAFLGKPRSKHVKHIGKVKFGMQFSMGLLASLCLLFGIFPVFILRYINEVPVVLFKHGLSSLYINNWLWLMPISENVSSYSPILVFVSIMIFCLIAYIVLKRFSYSFSYKKVPAWDCGFGGLVSRMQYTATAFSMPIRRVFCGFWKVEENTITESDEDETLRLIRVRYELHVQDWIWYAFYQRIGGWVQKIAKKMAYLQGGNIRVYLGYTFFTLLLLLLVIS